MCWHTTSICDVTILDCSYTSSVGSARPCVSKSRRAVGVLNSTSDKNPAGRENTDKFAEPKITKLWYVGAIVVLKAAVHLQEARERRVSNIQNPMKAEEKWEC